MAICGAVFFPLLQFCSLILWAKSLGIEKVKDFFDVVARIIIFLENLLGAWFKAGSIASVGILITRAKRAPRKFWHDSHHVSENDLDEVVLDFVRISIIVSLEGEDSFKVIESVVVFGFWSETNTLTNHEIVPFDHADKVYWEVFEQIDKLPKKISECIKVLDSLDIEPIDLLVLVNYV